MSRGSRAGSEVRQAKVIEFWRADVDRDLDEIDKCFEGHAVATNERFAGQDKRLDAFNALADRFDARLGKIMAIQMSILVSITVAAIMLALNLLVGR